MEVPVKRGRMLSMLGILLMTLSKGTRASRGLLCPEHAMPAMPLMTSSTVLPICC